MHTVRVFAHWLSAYRYLTLILKKMGMQIRVLFLQRDLRGVLCSPLCVPLLSCMYGRTVGIFNQAIFRSPLVDSDRRTAEEEVVRANRAGQRHS